jgi:uncharacterized protein
MPPDGPSGVRPARPSLTVGGRADALLTDAVTSMRIEETLDGLFHCEVTFVNWGPAAGAVGFIHFDRRTLDFGKDFVVSYGADTLFSGRITGIEGRFTEGRPPTATVLAEDRLQDLRMTRRTRTFAEMSDSMVINQVAGDHGLTPDVRVTGPTHKVVAQLNQSDLAFLRERARAVGAELRVSDRTLTVGPRQSGAATLRLGYGNELRRLEVLADLAHQRSSVDVTGWDVAGKAGLRESAGDSVVSGEVGADQSGASLLSTALGQRKETVAHSVPLTSQEARARAEALFRERARRFVTGRGVAHTDARLRVGAFVKLEGLGPLFTGDFYVSEVRHLFDSAKGMRTEFTVERPGLGRAA